MTIYNISYKLIHRLYQLTLSISLIPLKYLIKPSLLALFTLSDHLIIIPSQLFLKISLYSFVYLPMKPLLVLLNVEDKSSLANFVPQLQIFLINLIHYIVVGIMFGFIVGIMTGINLSIISYIFTTRSAKRVKKEKQNRFLNDLVKPVVITDHKPRKQPIRYRTPSITSSKSNDSISNFISSPTDLNNGFNYIYEDDDGYNYSSYNETINDTNKYPIKKETMIKEEIYGPLSQHGIKQESDGTDTIFNNEIFSMNRNDQLNTLDTEITIPENKPDDLLKL